MLRISKNAVNSVVVTLTENATVDNPIYLFEFENGQTHEKYFVISEDTSEYKNRYNRFSIEEKAQNADTLNGEITLGNEGWYNYTVYQTSLVEPIDWLSGAIQAQEYIVKIVEVGVCWVIFGERAVQVYTPTDEDNIAYQPGYAMLTEEGYNMLLEDGGKMLLEN